METFFEIFEMFIEIFEIFSKNLKIFLKKVTKIFSSYLPLALYIEVERIGAIQKRMEKIYVAAKEHSDK